MSLSFSTAYSYIVTARTSALDTLVFGVDVQSGDIRGDAPSYALVVFDGEEVERDVVSRRKLLRLVADREPTFLATDNAYELAADKDSLVHLLRGLPHETKLVQVTGGHEPEPLSRVASRHDVPYAKKPMREAEASARLAARRVGKAVTAFEETTELKVARGRSTGKGGWSEDRYTRRMHGAVKTEAREVESKLDDAGLAYERDVTEKYGGFSNAVFRVEAPPQDIPVSERRSGDTRVEIERERKDGIEFESLVQRRDYVIVGMDPGTTTALGLVDLDGNVLDTWSSRTVDTAGVIEWIIEHGRPVIVAADVTPVPDTVEKIRRSFDAAGWVPESDLPIDEKQHRTREHGYGNDHQRDALAAALFAYDDHAEQFERIAAKTPPREDRGEITAEVLSTETSVEAVLRERQDDGEDETEDSEHTPRELTAEERRIRELETRVERLEAHNAELKAEVEERDEKIAEYESELEDARREERRDARERRAVSRLERDVNRLESELEDERERADALESKLERLKALWKLDHSNFSDVDSEERDLVPVKVVEQFTNAAIEDAQERYGLAPDDVVLLRDASGAGETSATALAATEPRVVLTEHGGLSDVADVTLFEAEIPVGPAEDVAIQEVDELAVARESDVEAAIDDWEDRAEERRKERKASMVDELISEHRARGDGD